MSVLDLWPQRPPPGAVYLDTVLDVVPVPKGRPRSSPAEYVTYGGRRVKVKAGHTYTPARTETYEDKIGWQLRQVRPVKGAGELGVHAVFYVPGNTADLDNLLKALLDAGNGVIWDDDKQVTRIVADVIRRSGRPRIELAAFTRTVQ